MTEDGLDVEDAVAKLGNMEDIVNEIMIDAPMSTLVKNRFRPKGG